MTTFTRTEQRSNSGTGFVMSIGLLTMRVDLSPIRKPNSRGAGGFKMVCPHPDHDYGTVGCTVELPAQRYICQDDPSHSSEFDDLPGYPAGEMAKARLVEIDPPSGDDDTAETAEVWVTADAEDIAEARTGGMETGGIDLAVHPAWQIDALCRPGDHQMRVRPAKIKSKVSSKDLEVYAVVTAALEKSPHLALVGSMVVREKRRVYRLSVWGTQLLLTELHTPADLAERDVLDASDLADSDIDMLRDILAQLTVDFDEDRHRYDVEEAVAALMARNAEVLEGADVVPTKEGSPNVVDLTALLTQMRDSAKAA